MRQEAALDIQQKCERDPTSKGVVCHTHVGYPILANVVKEVSEKAGMERSSFESFKKVQVLAERHRVNRSAESIKKRPYLS